MAKESGVKVLLQVADPDNPSPTEFASVAGQQSTEFVGDTETDDVTDKTHSGWGSTLQILRRGTINCSGKADWPDTTGLDRIRSAWQNQQDIECKAILNNAGAHYRGFFQVTQFNVSGTHTNSTEYSVTLANNGALTYAAS